jgi:hypothetical protein
MKSRKKNGKLAKKIKRVERKYCSKKARNGNCNGRQTKKNKRGG